MGLSTFGVDPDLLNEAHEKVALEERARPPIRPTDPEEELPAHELHDLEIISKREEAAERKKRAREEALSKQGRELNAPFTPKI